MCASWFEGPELTDRDFADLLARREFGEEPDDPYKPWEATLMDGLEDEDANGE